MNRNEIKSTNSQADEANLHAEKKTLEQQVKELQNEVHQLKIKRDIYEKAVDVLKKDKGINIDKLTNREKAIIINALSEYAV